MQYIEYIQNGTSGRGSGWGIPLNYHPSVTTNVKMVVKALTGEDGYLLVGSMGSSGDYFRFFSYQSGYMYFDCPNDSECRLEVQTGSGATEWEMGVDNNGDYYLTNLTTSTTATGSSYASRVFNGNFYVFDDGGATVGNIAQGQRIYYIEIYENGTKVKDYRPVLDNNMVVCLYETIGGTFHYCSNTLTAGPSLSSISATPSKTRLAASGEAISIVVSCANAWTVSGNTWITLSSTGDTSGTTITATAPNYTGTTNRTDTLVFTDTVTGDDMSFTLTQKKLQTGVPAFLGIDEIDEMFVGEDQILEGYIGEDLVFSFQTPPPL